MQLAHARVMLLGPEFQNNFLDRFPLISRKRIFFFFAPISNS